MRSTSLKIANGEYGASSLGQMVPAVPELASRIQLEEEEEKYRALLQNQLQWIRDNQSRIVRNAEKLYQLLMQEDDTKLKPYELSIRTRACDVRALEAALQNYLQTVLNLDV